MAETKNMTEGNPVRAILAFAIPLLIGNIFQQVYTMVDTMVVGHLVGDHAISAIGATSSLYGLLINLASSMNTGYAIITTQAFGAQDRERMRRSVAGMFVLNVAATLLVTALSVVFLRPLLRFMNTPEGIFEEAYAYILILCGGIFSTVAYNMFAGILRAVGNSRTPLYYLILSSALNVVLDLLFVGGMQMGVSGAAAATVIAQVVSGVCCGVSFFRHYAQMVPKREDYRLCRGMLPELLSSGSAMALMLCVVNLGSLVFQRANNGLGETMIAAYTAGRKVIETMMQPLGTLATANTTFVSQNWGARKYGRIRQAMRRVIGLEIGWGVLSCAIIFLFGEQIVRLITGTRNEVILSNAVLAMRISLVFFPVLGVLLCLRTAMQAMGRKIAPVLSSCIELLMKALGAWLLIPAYGFLGTCVTEPLTWVLMCIFLAVVYWIQSRSLFSEANWDRI